MKRQYFLKELNKFKHYIAYSNDFFIKGEKFKYGKLIKLTTGQLIKKYGAIEPIIACFSKDVSVYDKLLLNKNFFLMKDDIKHNTKLVLSDISFIEGKVGNLSDEEFQQNLKISSIVMGEKINYWNYVNPFWLIYKMFMFFWMHKVAITKGVFITVVATIIISFFNI